MKFLRLFSMLFALTFALTLTLPALPNTGPPAPKTENLKKEVKNQSVSDVAVTGITSEACRDVGTQTINTVTTTTDKLQLENPDNTLYLDRPERPVLRQYGYVSKRLCTVTLNKIKPPALE